MSPVKGRSKSLLWVKSRHLQCKQAWPLYPRKRSFGRFLSKGDFDVDQCSNRKQKFSSTLIIEKEKDASMRIRLISFAFAISLLPAGANAQLTIDMNNIKCDQYLAMSPSESRSFSAWMSGWFSYQLNKTTIDLITHEKNVANVKAWCQYHPQETVMSGLKNATGQ
jgi:hypothetical protein